MGGLGESGTGQALAIEIRIRLSRGKSIKIILSGAGAQTGDLFFIPRNPLGQVAVKTLRSFLLFKISVIICGRLL